MVFTLILNISCNFDWKLPFFFSNTLHSLPIACVMQLPILYLMKPLTFTISFSSFTSQKLSLYPRLFYYLSNPIIYFYFIPLSSRKFRTKISSAEPSFYQFCRDLSSN